ncbi:helix-turn-helix transcriptional regulator [Thiocystis violascens]|uniref:Putative transcriptional regulator n=1 Tax=Thiocystis violascens (strain ATCC 17096 / DSM 198 / 6111) TaxID=765911 RepID=I3Y8A2_THIV6|nr:helix-turn-helix transcriptional regulator [Thiocystis violascens]AFL73220.1 putative transcriptional regulator [Thiocystis violascens DSM 198]
MKAKLGEALRLVRSFHDISQIELAYRLGISRSYLSELESGKKTPSIDLLASYAKVFEIPISYLLLFYETLEENDTSSKVRSVATQKALRLLNWIESIRKSNQSDAA